MNIEDQARVGAIRIMDRAQIPERAIADECLRSGEVIPWEEDHLCSCTGFSNRSHGFLHRGRPDLHIGNGVWLIHDAEDDIGFVLVLSCELTPEVGKLRIRGTTLPNDLVLESCVVVNIDDAVSTRGKKFLHKLVILIRIRGIQSSCSTVRASTITCNIGSASERDTVD